MEAPVEIRKATLADLNTISAIEKRVFPDPWTYEQLRSEIDLVEIKKTWVIVYDTSVIGYLISHKIGIEYQIVNFAVDLPWQHRGYGSKLLRYYLEKLSPEQRVFLEVKRSNWNAIQLYINTGFQEIGICKKYYADGEDALIMALEQPSKSSIPSNNSATF